MLSGEIMRSLDRGETFIITRNGMPVGELTPLRRHRVVAAERVVTLLRNAPGIDAARFRADVDAVADPEGHPRACGARKARGAKAVDLLIAATAGGAARASR